MYDLTLNTGSGPATIRVGLPPASLFKFPPDELPATLPAPQLAQPTWYQPFNIPTDLYNQLLDVRVPITIASVYAVSVVLLNRFNKSRGYKPWAISQTRIFKLFVILHNVFLAVYSAWTFAGMFRAFRNAWPAWNDPSGLVGVTDALCKCTGPRGWGNAATYDPTADIWTMQNPQFQLAEGGVPDPADVGRLWNQGLAYLGWIFYLSKFYEVLDTAIILAKGKKSSTLQTYHHAGAMMCMWAGIRYAASPIWIFTLVNSAIHAMMYTYYTLTAVRIRVPNVVKRSLTTMQITQFVIGSSMAASYLFVSYTLPVGSSGAATTVAASSATPLGWFKQLALGEDAQGNATVSVGPMTTCMDTTGQAFAIWLNVAYLLPLTYLFARFFVRSYLYRKESQPTHMHVAEKAGLAAIKGVTREMQRSVEMGGELSGEASEGTEDDAATQVAQQSKPSPIRTRSRVAGSTTKVSSKKSVKTTVAPGVKTTNPFGVLA